MRSVDGQTSPSALSALITATGPRLAIAPATTLAAPPSVRPGLCGSCGEVGKVTQATERLPYCGHVGMCADCRVKWAEAWATPASHAAMSLCVCPHCLQTGGQRAAEESAEAAEEGGLGATTTLSSAGTEPGDESTTALRPGSLGDGGPLPQLDGGEPSVAREAVTSHQ